MSYFVNEPDHRYRASLCFDEKNEFPLVSLIKHFEYSNQDEKNNLLRQLSKELLKAEIIPSRKLIKSICIYDVRDFNPSNDDINISAYIEDTDDDYWTFFLPVYTMGAIQIEDNKYIMWDITEINKEKKLFKVSLYGFFYYSGIWLPYTSSLFEISSDGTMNIISSSGSADILSFLKDQIPFFADENQMIDEILYELDRDDNYYRNDFHSFMHNSDVKDPVAEENEVDTNLSVLMLNIRFITTIEAINKLFYLKEKQGDSSVDSLINKNLTYIIPENPLLNLSLSKNN